MSRYEKILQERCATYEKRIESFCIQLDIEKECAAKIHIELQNTINELRTALEASRQVSEVQKAQIEKLTDMLRMLNPFTACNGKINSACELCYENPHAYNCYYAQMTKEG